MASKTGLTTITVFLILNTVFISLVSATNNNPPHATTCPIDALKLRVCANLLNGLLGIKIGGPPTPSAPCCSLIQGLADVEAATCVCTALRANVLGIIHLNVPLSLNLLLNKCGCKLPSGFTCP